PFWLEVIVCADALRRDGLEPGALEDRHLRRPIAAPARAVKADALAVDLRPAREIIERTREHAVSMGAAEDRRLAGAGHVGREGADTLGEIEAPALGRILLAAVEAGREIDNRRRPYGLGQPQIADDLLAFERNAHHLDRRLHALRVGEEGV